MGQRNKKHVNYEHTESFASPVIDKIVAEPKTSSEAIVHDEPKRFVVSGCTALNVREKQTTRSRVVKVIPAGTEVICTSEFGSGHEFVAVCIATGETGFCMQKYLTPVE